MTKKVLIIIKKKLTRKFKNKISYNISKHEEDAEVYSSLLFVSCDTSVFEIAAQTNSSKKFTHNTSSEPIQ